MLLDYPVHVKLEFRETKFFLLFFQATATLSRKNSLSNGACSLNDFVVDLEA